MDHKKSNQISSLISQIDTTLEPFFLQKLPQLSENAQKIIAQYTPILTVIGTIFVGIGLLTLFGSLLFLMGVVGMGMPYYPYAGMYATQSIASVILSLVFLLIQVGLQAMAIPGLFKNERNAWNLLYAGILVGLVKDALSFDIVSFVISFLISFYLLYQIKSYFNK